MKLIINFRLVIETSSRLITALFAFLGFRKG